jgi:hypothetical protein
VPVTEQRDMSATDIAIVGNGTIQPCTVHKLRNLVAHAPRKFADEIAADYSDMICAREALSATQSAAILLGNANYYGTLAAVRALGRAGVKVVTVDPSMIWHSRYSRYSGRHLTCPAFEDFQRTEWLLRKARIGPSRAIYATSDAVLFALARYRNELSADFEL